MGCRFVDRLRMFTPKICDRDKDTNVRSLANLRAHISSTELVKSTEMCPEVDNINVLIRAKNLNAVDYDEAARDKLVCVV